MDRPAQDFYALRSMLYEAADWQRGLLGGACIGGASALILWLHGRLLGVSGLIRSVLSTWDEDDPWRAAFLAGLLAGGAAAACAGWRVFTPLPGRGLWVSAVAGLLVGIGVALGNGCTSGHGICGVSRLSRRSIAATITFIATGAAAVWAFRFFGGSR